VKSLRLAATRHGLGLFATRRIPAGTEVLEFDGELVAGDQVPMHCHGIEDRFLQVGPNLYRRTVDTAAWVNHSCAPNCGLRFDGDRVWLVTLRAVLAGEEITFDYSTSCADDWTMECGCGAPTCRGLVGAFNTLPIATQLTYIHLGMTPAFVRPRRAIIP
jgi:SET domain-containing protein